MNRYIKAMEIGLAHEEKGISYFDLVKGLRQDIGDEWAKEAEITFFYWFIENFQPKQRIRNNDDLGTNFFIWRMKNPNPSDSDLTGVMSGELQLELGQKWFLKGQAAKQYLDYLELQESRIAATQARKQSNYSIWIAIGAILISTLLGAYSIKSSPEPPYDVKIVDDRTGIKELEKENDSLRNELHEAQILIGISKSDSLE
jgi:hypothetical protein